MTATDLQDRIGSVFVRHLHIERPDRDRDLIESGMIDSLTLVELIANLEQEFTVRIPLDDLDLNQFRSIAHIAEFIGTLIQKSEVPVGTHSRV